MSTVRRYVVQRLEDGNRTEFRFPTLKEALGFITSSERRKKTKDGWRIDGEYELYRIENPKDWKNWRETE